MTDRLTDRGVAWWPAPATYPAPASSDGPNWRHHAICAQVDPELFAPAEVGENQYTGRFLAAVEICRSCPVKGECAAYAARHQCLGVWGGEVLSQRRTYGGRITADPLMPDEHGCGTLAGARRHYRAGTRLCAPCAAASAAYRQRYDRGERAVSA